MASGRGPSTSTFRGTLWALGGAVMAAVFVLPWKVAAAYDDEALAVLFLLLGGAVTNTLLVPLLRRPGTPSTLRDRRIWGLALAFALAALVGNVMSAEAITRVSATTLSVLQRGEVLVVALLAWMVLGERVDLGFWLGTAVAIAGVVVVQGAVPGADHAWGTLLGIGSSVAFATMVVLARRWVHAIDPAELNALRLWISVLMWFAAYRRIPDVSTIPLPLAGHAFLAGVLGPGLGRLFSLFSARHIEARLTALCMLAAPAITLALSPLILGEIPNAREVIGGAIILLGVALPLRHAAVAARADGLAAAAQR